eukprot:9502064-Pyramimonas_sp.AAC.1
MRIFHPAPPLSMLFGRVPPPAGLRAPSWHSLVSRLARLSGAASILRGPRSPCAPSAPSTFHVHPILSCTAALAYRAPVPSPPLGPAVGRHRPASCLHSFHVGALHPPLPGHPCLSLCRQRPCMA